MREKLTSLRFRMILPVIAMTLFVVILLTTLFSRRYIRMIMQQEQDVNTVALDTVSRTITPVINASISEVRSIMTDERMRTYTRHQFASVEDLIHARIECRDYLNTVIVRNDGIFGVFVMRMDGSLVGLLPDAALFYDNPDENPLPETMKAQILNMPLGQTVWVGPVSGTLLYGFENEDMPESVMIAAWKSVDISYGECCVMMLMDESVFDDAFGLLQDGKSSWHIFTADRKEIYHTGEDTCPDVEEIIRTGNDGTTFHDENGRPFCGFSLTMSSPDWTLVRLVSLVNSAEVVNRVRLDVGIIASVVFLIALILYELWLKRFMRQFASLLKGIVRMGQGDLESKTFVPSSINEFRTMQREINRTRLALNHQMEMIRQMERTQMELETKRKEQELMIRELSMAREIQKSALPHTFPPFPERKEINLFASTDPARDVGGDFYDFFFIDEDHLCLNIADVSGKGIPAALFMMVAKRILEDSARLEHSVSEILEKTNVSLCDSNQAEMFVTVWLGILEISTGRLIAANAGHEYPVVRKKDGRFTLIKDKHGFVIGGMKGVRYREYIIQMSPGDKIFVYTDGVPEATDGGGEMFGVERMVEALNTCGDGTPEEILKGVRESVDAFVGDTEQFDDLTMMCLEYLGSESESTWM